uniref:Heat shock protein n=1 Tax=Dinoroseobacter phage vB_DshS_R26L TaxID=3161158 RepID=A0AAU7VGS7_9CAUD
MSDDILAEMAEDGQKVTTDLREVKALADKQLALEAKVAKIEADLKAAKADLRKVQEGDLPAALKAAGIPSFTLDNGMTVSYDEDLKISVPKARKDAIIKLMKEWGYEGNVSNTLTADLGKGNDNAVKALKAAAEEMGVEVVVTEDIPTGTVKKALRTRIDEGKNDDLAFFGAFSFTKATVK